MRKIGYIGAASFIVCFGLHAVANGAPLQLKHVAADSAWLGHVDLDAMRESIVVRKAMEEHQFRGGVEMVKHVLGMDLESDLHGMTFYGNELGKHTGVMIVQAKIDRDRLLGMANRFTKPEVMDFRKHKLHRWTHKSRRGAKGRQVAGAFYDDHTLVFASSVDELKRAVDVLDGEAPSLTKSDALAGNIPPGTTMLMRVAGVSEAEGVTEHRLARRTKSFRFVTGEHDGESFYRARATMTDPEIAGQLKEVVEGFRAVGQLHVGDNETGRQLVNDLRVKTQGPTVTVLWKGAAKDVWTMVKTHQKIFEEIKSKRRHHRNRHRDGASGEDHDHDHGDSTEEDF